MIESTTGRSGRRSILPPPWSQPHCLLQHCYDTNSKSKSTLYKLPIPSLCSCSALISHSNSTLATGTSRELTTQLKSRTSGRRSLLMEYAKDRCFYHRLFRLRCNRKPWLPLWHSREFCPWLDNLLFGLPDWSIWTLCWRTTLRWWLQCPLWTWSMCFGGSGWRFEWWWSVQPCTTYFWWRTCSRYRRELVWWWGYRPPLSSWWVFCRRSVRFVYAWCCGCSYEWVRFRSFISIW